MNVNICCSFTQYGITVANSQKHTWQEISESVLFKKQILILD